MEDELVERLHRSIDLERLLEKQLADPLDRTILKRFVEGYTAKEIADDVGGDLNSTAIRKRKSRALSRIRKSIKEKP